MAEFLIKMEGAVDDPLAWSRLDPVCVFEDGHPWGAMERPPKFLVVRVTGMTAAAGQQYLETVMSPILDAYGMPVTTRLRAHKFGLDDTALPKPIQNAIAKAMQSGGIVTVNLAQATAFIKRMT